MIQKADGMMEGMVVDILDAIVKEANSGNWAGYTIKTPKSGQYGTLLKGGWDGVIGDVQNGVSIIWPKSGQYGTLSDKGWDGVIGDVQDSLLCQQCHCEISNIYIMNLNEMM